MGLFDFLRRKRDERKEMLEKMSNSFFPKGEKDINAATSELQTILQNKVSKDLAKTIVLKSIAISRLSQNFDVDRLKIHLKGYCIEHFNEAQIQQFYNYLVALSAAMSINRRTPSEVTRTGSGYQW